MKTIGLLGGAAWVSTVEYYRSINRQVRQRLGKNHSAKIILNSIDYETIKQYNYQNWEKIGEILMDEILKLDACNVDCILVCNNTLHKALDDIASHLYVEAPIFHIADCVGEHAKAKGYTNVLLLGTKFTMENGFYHHHLKQYQIEAVTPSEEERNEIQRINQEELSREIVTEESKAWLQGVVKKYTLDAVVIACTELPLIIKQEDYDVPILNTLELHCEKAINFALHD